MSSSDEDFKLNTPKGTPYRIKDGPTFKAELHGPLIGSVTVICHTKDVGRLLDECLPVPYFGEFSQLADETFFQVLKLDRPYCPGVPGSLTTTSFEVVGLNRERPLNVFGIDERPAKGTAGFAKTYEPLAEVTLEFSTRPESLRPTASETANQSNLRPELFLESSFNVNAEVLSIGSNRNTLVGSSVSGEDADVMLDFAAPMLKLIPIVEETHTWRWARNPDFEKIFNLLGTVNQGGEKFLGFPHPETYLFLGVCGKLDWRWSFKESFTKENSRLYLPSTIAVHTLDYKFAKRHFLEPPVDNPQGQPDVITWNHIYSPDHGKWKRLFIRQIPSQKKVPLYRKEDFLKLFLVRKP